MGNIVVLDELTINQIAAGEVIEGPKNVVKELVENSIDAGSTSISVEIKNGGISYIRVSDNGKGIEKDDLEIAFERHATSKIRSSDDLLKVNTMGFRGEALASIAAVSNVELISCFKDSDIGNRIIVEGGNILLCEECGCPKGTTITVNNMFYNTPVRYKFLKRDFTEAGYIEDIVCRLAIINPHISFKLINSGKTIISTSGNGDMVDVIHNIYGKDVSSFLVKVDYEYEGLKINGLIGKPQIARSNRNNQITYINKRHVKNKTMSAAIDEAYKTIIPNGKFAFAVLNLTINNQLVDVNVHPAKLEVRFQNEGDVFKAIYHAVKSSLLGNDLSRIIQDSNTKQEDIKNKVIDDIKQTNFSMKDNISRITNSNEQYNQINKPLNNIINNDSVNILRENIENRYGINNNVQKEDIAKNQDIIDEAINDEFEYNKTNEINNNEENKKQEIASTINLFEKIDENEESKKEFKYIGTVFSTYNIIEYCGEMYIIDQHAMHERVLYEQVKKSYYSDEVLSQMILIPQIITLTNRENDIIKDNIEMFEKSGYILEEFGDNTFKITGVPYICIDLDVKELFLDILDGINENVKTSSDEKIEKFISTIACKAAVKANMNLKDEEVIHLIEQVLELDNPFTCPHGRPTAIKMSKYDLERKFGRK